jgi:hypothetical protein
MNAALRSKTSAAAGDSLGITTKSLQRTTSSAAGNGLGATIKYLRCTTSGAAGNGLGTAIGYLHVAAGIGLGTTLNYLRGAAGNGRAQRSSTFDAHRAPPRETALATRQVNTALQCTTSAATGTSLGNTIKYLQRTTSGEQRRGHRPS